MRQPAFAGPGDQGMLGVTAGGPGLVAIGTDSSGGDKDVAVWTSSDGLVWFRVPHEETIFGGTYDQVMSAVTVGGPGLVAVGYEWSGEDWNAAVWTSADGLTWSRMPGDESVFGGPGDQLMAGVTAGGPGLVAAGTDASGGDEDVAVWTSADGLTWERVPHDETIFGGPGRQSLWAVTVGGPGLVAIGYASSGGDVDAAVWTSADGLTWSRMPGDESVFGGPGDQLMLGVTVGGPGLVAVGTDGSSGAGYVAVWVSPPPG